MRITNLFGKTLREAPAEAETISHQLLIRAGMINQLAAGVYSYLPLGWKVIKKIESIIRDEMAKAGGQEVMLPVLQPLELWEKSGRLESFGKSLLIVTDRKEHQLVLGPTHEEVITDLVAHNVQSYRDLPLLLYQLQTKFRDEPRPRGGLLRVREFGMKDLYSFDTDTEGLNLSYSKMLQAYKNIFTRCGLPSVMVEADSGAIGGKDSHEFILLTGSGEDEIASCSRCGYAANVEKAQSVKGNVNGGEPMPLAEVATPGMKTIEQVSTFLNVPQNHTFKAVFYICDGKLIFVVIRGDLDVNDVKLKNLLRGHELRLASDIEVKSSGIVAGSASPVGISNVRIIADDSVISGTNFVAGGNKPDVHLKNVNYPRDFKADIVADIARAKAGQGCPRCGGVLVLARGIEVGHVFKLGTFLSEKLGAYFVDVDGISRPIVMGCYGIGIGRLLAAAIEQNHDDKGIIWPLPIAPYQVHLCPLFLESAPVKEVAENLYKELCTQSIAVLYDDRTESAGVKFNDADLLGMPLRITVSPRSLEKNSVELKKRPEKKAELVPFDRILDRIKELITAASTSLNCNSLDSPDSSLRSK